MSRPCRSDSSSSQKQPFSSGRLKKTTFRVSSVCIVCICTFAVFSAVRSTRGTIQGLNAAENKKQIDPYAGEYASAREEQDRRFRFPSIESRVKYYMGIWYSPPCSYQDKILYTKVNDSMTLLQQPLGRPDGTAAASTIEVSPKIRMARMFYLDLPELDNCDSRNGYCSDTKSSVVLTFDKVDSRVPILLQ